MKLPEWEEVHKKDLANEILDPLEGFIYENCPAGNESQAKFRKELRQMLNYVRGEEWFDKDGA